MDVKVLIGKKVSHKKTGFLSFGDGTIENVVDNLIYVKFGSGTKRFQIETFLQFFTVDEESREIIDNEMRVMQKAKAEADAAKKAAEDEKMKQAAEEAAKKAADEAAHINAKSKPIHPYIDQRRNNGKHVVFLVCQNDNYQVESTNGFIWAPTHIDKGETDLASHAEMDHVKSGDIIFHHFANRVWAISVAKKDCEIKAPVSGHPNAGEDGRYVELNYHFLDVPADTSSLKAEKVKYGSMKYGPFEKTGKNKEGFYLSEVADELAMAFIDAAITANPHDKILLDIKSEI